MRDSLSILDKIVSFTNGEVTYKNTLEHLNILDEDYYFKLLEFVQQQDMGSALLMFDEINRKGFEGDLVLNGFAEFLRNLLVSRDAKVALLLEVAEDFKQKYLQTAQNVAPAYIISALNVLNEAEINYKQARNKRLHVELTIIKLSYLQQALELVSNDGVVSKKKQLDGVKTIAFKALQPVIAKEPIKSPPSYSEKSSAKLIIEQPLEQVDASSPAVAQKAVVKPSVAQPRTVSTADVKSGGLGSLSNIRQQIAQKNKAGGPEVKTLTEEDLHTAWGLFIEKLRKKNNHSAVTNFKLAFLNVIDNNTIEIITQGEIHKAFIEVERADLVTHLQDYFNNRLLVYQVVVKEQAEQDTPTEVVLNRKQQYFKMIEEYPLVKELRDRLKLELE